MALLSAAPRAAGTMVLTRLTLTDFRSYAAAEMAPDAGLTVVAGPTGAGKTNLLEAIHTTVVGPGPDRGGMTECPGPGRPG